MSLSAQILLSLLLGGVAGVFFGEFMAPLAVIGDVFVRLLQMTVLPYVVVSLMGGLGRLDYHDARRLGGWFLGLLALLWILAFTIVALMPLAFPTLQSASFFSTTLVEPAPVVDFVGLYVPTNPFHALANNIVPAVVLFSVALGVALIGIPDKNELLRTLDTVAAALLRVSEFIVRLTPIGVFAIGASAAGTMSVEEFARVQVYLVSYIAFALVATFWLLPGLVSVLTPLTGRQVIGISKDAMVTAFATGSSFVVIPLLAANSKALLEQGTSEDEKLDSLVDVIIPASHNFPHTAKVLTLSFILFAGWFDDSPVPISDYPFLFVSGIAATFGSVTIAIPFLLDLMRLPHDLFQLFIATGVLNARFGTLLQAMHMLALTLLGACALTGRLRIRPRALLGFAALSILLLGLTVGGVRALFSITVDTSYSKGGILQRMRPVLGPVDAIVYREEPELPSLDPQLTRLEEIQQRGLLRVCFRESIPFSYFNDSGELIGMDVEMANSLAQGLNLKLKLVPWEIGFGTEKAATALTNGSCDVYMGRTAVTMDAVGVVAYAVPHLEMTFGFVVKDHRRREFASIEALASQDLNIAIPNAPYYKRRFERYMPEATFIPVDHVREFLEAEDGRFDALVYPVEIGSIWSLIYPDFGIVVPPRTEKIPMAYMLPIGEPEWESAVDTWVELKKTDGTVERLYDHWILGRESESAEPRWSVIRDVLGWVN